MPNGFVLRYDTVAKKDGLPRGEGAFLACSFWLADACVLRRDDARKLFERILSLRNDLGPPQSGCWAIFRRRSPISPWSTRPKISRGRRSRASSVPGTHFPGQRHNPTPI
jgi:hypothetical protein